MKKYAILTAIIMVLFATTLGCRNELQTTTDTDKQVVAPTVTESTPDKNSVQPKEDTFVKAIEQQKADNTDTHNKVADDEPTQPDKNTEQTKKVTLAKDIEQPKANNTDVPNTEDETVPTEPPKDTETKLTCTMSVVCQSILASPDKLKPEKRGLVPEDGVIYHAKTIEFADGESAFDLLLREMRSNNIHIEFEYTPGFDSTYVEGIGNIYEFDCGDMSGWMYKVNGKTANYGSSQYLLCPGDVVEWVYVCG